jgi:hypothetical protein
VANIPGITPEQQALVDAIIEDHPDRVNWLCKTKLTMPMHFSWIVNGEVKTVHLPQSPTVEQWRYMVVHLYDDHNYNVGSRCQVKKGKLAGPTGLGYLQYEADLFHYHPVR